MPSLVDPKVPHIDYYAGASLDHAEPPRSRSGDAACASAPPPKRARRRSGSASGPAATACSSRAASTACGCWRDGEFDLPAEAREVSDVTGAGDTVIAAIALGLAAGGSLSDAARLANRAAGLAVGKFGAATVAIDELRQSTVDSR